MPAQVVPIRNQVQKLTGKVEAKDGFYYIKGYSIRPSPQLSGQALQYATAIIEKAYEGKFPIMTIGIPMGGQFEFVQVIPPKAFGQVDPSGGSSSSIDLSQNTTIDPVSAGFTWDMVKQAWADQDQNVITRSDKPEWDKYIPTSQVGNMIPVSSQPPVLAPISQVEQGRGIISSIAMKDIAGLPAWAFILILILALYVFWWNRRE